jgi:hypothetical protein
MTWEVGSEGALVAPMRRWPALTKIGALRGAIPTCTSSMVTMAPGSFTSMVR